MDIIEVVMLTRRYWLVLLLLCAGCASVVIEPAPSNTGYVYKLGTGDRLRIMVFGEANLSGEFAVDGTGAIAYPLLGQIIAKSKTATALRDEITARLGAEFVRNPKVSVEVINHRPVYILGEVARPGEFPFVEGLGALALIAKAGGFTYRANQKMLYVRHEAEAEEKAYALTGALIIQPGDTVRVGERYF